MLKRIVQTIIITAFSTLWVLPLLAGFFHLVAMIENPLAKVEDQPIKAVVLTNLMIGSAWLAVVLGCWFAYLGYKHFPVPEDKA